MSHPTEKGLKHARDSPEPPVNSSVHKSRKITDCFLLVPRPPGAPPPVPVFTPVVDLQEAGLHARVTLCNRFLSKVEADSLLSEFQTSQRDLFTRDVYHMRGKSIPSPRLICSYGDQVLSYHYTGVERSSRIWFPKLRELRDRVQPFCSHPLNYALVNWYRNGQDHIGWHSDKENDLVPGSTICSVSLGASRVFHLRKKKIAKSGPKTKKRLEPVPKEHKLPGNHESKAKEDHESDAKECKNPLDHESNPVLKEHKILLNHGSVLLMEKNTQRLYIHSVQKSKKVTGVRINITFRSIAAPSSKPQ